MERVQATLRVGAALERSGRRSRRPCRPTPVRSVCSALRRARRGTPRRSGGRGRGRPTPAGRCRGRRRRSGSAVPLRCEISSIPIRLSPSSRSTSRRASSATRSQIAPTVRHATRISSATAVFERVDRQPRRLVLKGAREPRVVARPRHRADHDTVAAARHPRRVGLDERNRRAEVQRPPATTALAEVIAPARDAGRPRSDHARASPAGRYDHLALVADRARPRRPLAAARAAAPIP